MPRFFLGAGDSYTPGDRTMVLSGENASHISRSLRMAPGEELTVCDGCGRDFNCRITDITAQEVELEILSEQESKSEPDVSITLYQASPKGDKMELIVQKAVELGVHKVVPVLTRRCISRPDGKTAEKKRQRLQKIALEAAKQSGRGIIPAVEPMIGWKEALSRMKEADCPIVFYESRGTSLRELLQKPAKNIAVMIGSEGGFDPEEIEEARTCGIPVVNLGPRILRCETAPLCALSAILFATGNLE